MFVRAIVGRRSQRPVVPLRKWTRAIVELVTGSIDSRFTMRFSGAIEVASPGPVFSAVVPVSAFQISLYFR